MHSLSASLVILAFAASGAAFADPPVSIVENGSTGGQGSNGSIFAAGGTGGEGSAAVGSSFTYTFGPALSSTAVRTPAFNLQFTGGGGGKGGPSSCCNGGSGRFGALPVHGTTDLNGVADLTTQQASSPGLLIDLKSGNGGGGGNSGAVGKGGDGGAGAYSTNNLLDNQIYIRNFDESTNTNTPWNIITLGDSSPGMQVFMRAGNGGGGGTGATAGSRGGTGGAANNVNVGFVDTQYGLYQPFAIGVQTSGDQSPGLSVAQSPNDGNRFGAGGQGGANDAASGGVGGTGGKPLGQIIALTSSSLVTAGDTSSALVALSQGGKGGKGGTGKVLGNGGTGGSGGGGGDVAVYLLDTNTISTAGSDSHGISAYSLGGDGGQSGDGSFISNPGQPGAAAASGSVTVDLSRSVTTITTKGDESFGVIAQSIGGHGGSASSVNGLVSFAANGGSAGAGGEVTIDTGLGSGGSITTSGQGSTAIGAYSLGGGGGHGGTAFGVFYGGGGSGGAGGSGRGVTVFNQATLSADDFTSDGILAQSIGGAGGSGGSTVALASVGGRAGPASSGGAVTVQNVGAIETGKSASSTPNAGLCAGCAYGILAQSIGGGGGKAGSAAGWFNFGGTAGGGGAGSEVTIANAGSVTTNLAHSGAIQGQSIGGGGGAGGGAAGGGVALAASIGGSGGTGGAGGAVMVASGAPSDAVSDAQIATAGRSSPGLVGQSIGGGGGHGGYAVSATASFSTPSISVGVGGTGGGGGSASDVTVTQFGDSTKFEAGITTTGDMSHGLLAQSTGGGGGHGGTAIAATVDVSGGVGLAVGAGGSGGGGGSGGTVAASTTGASISTTGQSSVGLFAQSTGGGGGDGGLSVAGSVTVGTSNSVDVSLGGKAGSGGAGSAVTVETDSAGAISTTGDHAEGILAQSIGGGGGRGALAVAGSLSSGKALNFSMGGLGGAGNSAGKVSVSAMAAVSTGSSTTGDHSAGIVAQSLAGGGGNGGTSIAADLSVSSSVGVSLGGGGGTGGKAGTVDLTSAAQVSTQGDHASGVLAQSVGGGGGNGGLSIAGSFTASDTVAVNLAVGGSGATGGTSGQVTASANSVSTKGQQSDAVVAQSLAGGGGNGGTSIAGNLTTSDSTAIGVAVGGSAKSGGAASSVSVTTQSTGTISATGAGSRGIFAQSVGGGGGHGGMAITGAFTNSTTTKDLSVSVGGSGGSGGSGGTVTVVNAATIDTGLSTSPTIGIASEHGVLAQSIGGGGGSGGLAASAGTNRGNRSLTVSVGGVGGGGSSADAVKVSNSGQVSTHGQTSHGILAQSIGGGGGAGGGTATFGLSSKSSKGFGVSVGGQGGAGSSSGAVSVTLDVATSGGTSAIITSGLGSRGVLAQSIAGGGGTGGANIFKNQSGSNDPDQLSVSVGGGGGVASSAGDVGFAMMPGGVFITTGSGTPNASDPSSAAQGHAVMLQSIGGGGGDGGAGIQGNVKPSATTVAVDIGVGGKGAGGGNGGAVTVGSGTALEGAIKTTDYSSHGLFAQSIGGGGGNAAAGIQGNVTNNASKGLTVGIGGSAGGGGTGGTVSINSAATIMVEGSASNGIVAQSVGGGGGAGAKGIAGNISGANDDGTTQVTFGLGGSGGGAGNGGAVAVGNTGTITTAAKASGDSVFAQNHAIVAQSVGGGGGIGAAGIAGNIANSSKSKAIGVTIGAGGAGGGAGSGSAVSVINTGALSVAGTGSRGILAHSIGGGGGTAGAGIAGNITAPTDASSDTQIAFGLGASAGKGGDGAQVTVTNSGAIVTAMTSVGTAAGDQAAGIHAQSIGGGGGTGGIGINGDVTGSKSSKALNLGIGGSGGLGGNAAAGTAVTSAANYAKAGVGVQNEGAISTVGDGSVGVLAQSIGGGGGNGAAGFDGTVSSGGGKAVTLAIGAIGGSGGDGGTVAVNNLGSINTGTAASTSDTATSQAHGIFAQSIGGGGGSGMHTGSLIYGSTKATGTEHGIDLTVGGSAVAGSGEAVFVSTGTGLVNGITTRNRSSHGVIAQSVGGGGGLAGDLGGIGTSVASDQWAASVGIGGTGGAGGYGGNVTVIHSATAITTFGDGSMGLLAQSIGGGGGIGGDAAGLENSANQNQTTSNAKLAINIGSTGGTLGGSGAVSVKADGRVETNGIGAPAVFAQSVGGGGGVGGLGARGLSGTVTLGGSKATNLSDGGEVTVNVTGDISTAFGVGGPVIASHGIFAQSVGGGGGYGGAVQTTFPTFDPVPQGTNGGNSFTTGGLGSGGGARVTATGSIHTTGGSSAGIFAQSVGGGGGVAGTAGNQIYNAGWLGARIGSAGGVGNGGPVIVSYGKTAANTLWTSGVAAHGIFAQSAGGTTAPNPTSDNTVEVNVAGTVQTSGVGSFGVFAQTSGAMAGPIQVTIADTGSVKGGKSGNAGQANALTGAGVVMLGGTKANTLTNAGSLSAYSGIAALVENGTITNTGTMTGSVCRQAACGSTSGTNVVTMTNGNTGVLNAGENLGVALLTNNGVLSPFGEGTIGTTFLLGGLAQGSEGTLILDVDPLQPGVFATADYILSGGSAVTLDGTVDVNLLNVPVAGPQSAPFLSSLGTITYDQAKVSAPAAVDYDLALGINGLTLDYEVDFANSNVLGQTNDNQDNVAGHLQDIYESGALSQSDAENLLSIDDVGELAGAINTLGAELVIDNQIATLFSEIAFADLLLRCAQQDGATKYFEDGQCVFATIGGRQIDYDTKSDNLGFTADTSGIATGFQLKTDSDWIVGGAASYQTRKVSVDDVSATSNGDQIFFGATLKRLYGNWELAGSLLAGYGQFDIDRQTYPGIEVTGEQKQWSGGAQLRAAYLFDRGAWYAKPNIGIGVSHFSGSSYTEKGDTDLRLEVDGTSETFWNIQPAIEFGGDFKTTDGLVLRPSLTLGITQFIGNAEPTVDSRFVGAPNSVAPFETSTSLDRTHFRIGAGLDIFTASNVAVRANLLADTSSNTSSYGGGLSIEIPF